MWGHNAVCDLADEYEECHACPILLKTRTQVVFGSGSVKADILILGEAPGETEDKAGVPFVGNAGKLLMDLLRNAWPETDEILDIANIPDGDDEEYFEKMRDYLDDHVFWSNIILCWPGEGNRDPATKEIKACKDRLHRLIYAVDPMLIIAAGRVSVTAVLGKKTGIVENRGRIYDVGIKSPSTGRKVRYPMMAILHPSYLLRKGDQSLVAEEEGSTFNTLEDLRYALHLINEHYRSLWGTDFPYRPENYKT